MTEKEQRQIDLRNVRANLRDLRKSEARLEAQEREDIKKELQPMVGKCFVRNLGETETCEYVVIIDVPREEHVKGGVNFNEYQLPAIHFIHNETFCAIFETNTQHHGNPIFWYDTVFTGEMPAEYRRGAYNGIGHPEWREISQEEFKAAAQKRYTEFMRKIF